MHAEQPLQFYQLEPEQYEGRHRLEQESFLSRVREVGGRLALVGVLIAGGGVLAASEAQPAQAAGVSCYGDYCSGKYANETGCDQDARVIEQFSLTRAGIDRSVNVGPLGFGMSEPAKEVARVELKKSDICGTTWARLSTLNGNDICYLGVQQQGTQYAQYRNTGGRFCGTPAAISFTPMIYNRGRNARAFIVSREPAQWAVEDSTYWATI